MWNDTGASRTLGIVYPIIQGPFGGGLSSVELVAAASNAGALGSYGIHTEIILWGASISVLIIGLQGWVLELAPERPDAASALYVAAFNIGIGAGAMIGALALQTVGERAVLWTGITLGAGTRVALAMLMRGASR